jgi:hypothetical protein
MVTLLHLLLIFRMCVVSVSGGVPMRLGSELVLRALLASVPSWCMCCMEISELAKSTGVK